MKKDSKKTRKKKQKELTAALLASLEEREAGSLVIGIDLGDRTSRYCVRTLVTQEVVVEGEVATKAEALVDLFQPLERQRVAIETGTHSPWVGELLGLLGHEVIVGNSRKLKLITENDQKSDVVDSRLLSKLACVSVDWLHPVYQRSGETKAELTLVRAREMMMATRTALVNHVRGTVKSFGCRLSPCDAGRFVEMAQVEIPNKLRGSLSGVLTVLAELQEQIYSYDCQVKHACQTTHPETRWLLQVKGVGPVTALTYVLTIEDPQRFRYSREVGPYLGLVQKKRQSGNRDPQLGISKAGDEMLRKLLVNCAHTILTNAAADSDLRRWGLALLNAGQRAGNKGARSRAATAVARKLAVLLHRLWVDEATYVPLRKTVKTAAAAA